MSGLQLVAFIASKTCCALLAEMQRNHHHGHQHQYQIGISHPQGQGIRGGSPGLGKGNGGPSGPGQYAKLGIRLTGAMTDRVNGWAEILRRLGDPNVGIAPTLFIHSRCARLVDCLPSLQHDPNRPEDVLKVDADEEGVGAHDAADFAAVFGRDQTKGCDAEEAKWSVKIKLKRRRRRLVFTGAFCYELVIMVRLSGILVVILCASTGFSQEFVAVLSGTNEVPPNASTVVGGASLRLGTFAGPDTFGCRIALPCGRWRAGIYGPASEGAVGPRIFDFGPGRCATNRDGTIDANSKWAVLVTRPLDTNQIAQLRAGEWYVNVSSDLFPDGEVRGQLLPLDSDNDGVPDYLDRCPETPASALVDSDGCSIEQLCPCEGPWKNHGEYVRCYRDAIVQFLVEGRTREKQAIGLFEAAAASDCGKP